jgi:hypothetical protein
VTAAPDWVALLEKILTGAPALPGAKCRGRAHLFNDAEPDENPETVAARHTQALGLCKLCPSRTRCEGWYLGLPKLKRPIGVIAGRLNPQERRPPARPRNSAAS